VDVRQPARHAPRWRDPQPASHASRLRCSGDDDSNRPAYETVEITGRSSTKSSENLQPQAAKALFRLLEIPLFNLSPPH
jgi:hypothetical protein